MSFPRNKVAANATSSSKDVSLENKKRKVSGENTISSKKKRTVTGDFGKSDLDLRIETVSAASYVSGCLAFGYVLQVLPHHVLVSLPGGITGIVPETEVSDRLANPIDTHNAGGLDVHDPILCFVIGKSATDKQLRLSTRNSVVNRGINFKNLCVGYFIQGTIESKEDHG